MPIRYFGCFVGILVAAGLCVGPASFAEAQNDTTGLKIEKDEQKVKIFDAGRLFLSYKFADVPKKPYVAELFSPAGVQVLRDSPADHKHHHALMFAIAVDGVNFWEEHTPQSGKQVQRVFCEVKANSESTDGNAAGRAGFIEELDWLAPDSEKPLLCERREIHLLKLKDQEMPATLVQWRSRLSVPPEKKSASLEGRIYFGLGLRFLASMDRDGRYFHATDKPTQIIDKNESHLVAAKWCAYTASADGKPVTVAVFDHPQNPRHPATFFMKVKCFSYLSATMNLAEKTIELASGEPLSLCYAVGVWDGEVEYDVIEALYQKWLQQESTR